MDLPITQRAATLVPSASTTPRSRSPFRWWPLYLLGLLALALFAGDWLLPLSEGWRTFLLLPLTGVVCGLALGWMRRNERLLSSEGADARVHNDPVLKGLLEQAHDFAPWTPPHRGD